MTEDEEYVTINGVHRTCEAEGCRNVITHYAVKASVAWPKSVPVWCRKHAHLAVER